MSVPIDRPVQGKAWILVFVLYLAMLSVDAGRKVIGLPSSTLGIVYLLVGVIYLFLLHGMRSRLRAAPDGLPVWLALLSLWCLIEAMVRHVPIGMAILGWCAYVFFVPLRTLVTATALPRRWSAAMRARTQAAVKAGRRD